MLRIVLGIMMFVAAGMPARADYALGIIAYEQGDYTAAYENWKRLLLAEQGRPAAQYNIGHLFHHGLGVELDLDSARGWYRKAADQGDTFQLTRITARPNMNWVCSMNMATVRPGIIRRLSRGSNELPSRGIPRHA